MLFHFCFLQIVLTEMYYDGFHRSFCDTDDLDTIHESDCIFAFETPEIFRPEGILSQRGEWVTLLYAHIGVFRGKEA